MKKIVLYTKQQCPFCVSAKRLLDTRGMAYTEILIKEDDPVAWQEASEKSGMKTVPMIFADDELIGGFTDLDALDRVDQLASLKE